jgi:hypothetical protein
MIKKFRKKPIIIEAFQMTEKTIKCCLKHKNDSYVSYNNVLFRKRIDTYPLPKKQETVLLIDTSEGAYEVSLNDWVIKGIEGEFYPCKPDIFKKTYDELI